MATVIAIDNSISTFYVENYCVSVNNVIKQYNKPKLLLWSERAFFYEGEFIDDGLLFGTNTLLLPCLKLLENISYSKLIVITDGRVKDIYECKKVWREHKVEVHLIGSEKNMDLEICTIFGKQKIYFNNEPVASIDINDINFSNLTEAKATIISKIKDLTKEEKNRLLQNLNSYEDKCLKNFPKDPADKIEDCWKNNNIIECLKLVKSCYGNFTGDKKAFQSEIQNIRSLLLECENVYNLSNLKPLQFEENVEATQLECDILHEKCKQVCILVRETSEPILTHKVKSPFDLLNDMDVIEKILKCVEHYKIDFTSTYKNLNTDSSPFTRQKLKGVVVLHNGNIDVWQLINYNYKTLLMLYGNDLPGNRALWTVVFLYIIAKYHPVWKSYQDILFEEIRHIAYNVTTYMTLNPFLNPNMRVKMCIAFWYIANVSTFPNSDVSLGEGFYNFYCDLYGVPQVFDIQKCNLNEVRAQFQNYKIIKKNLIFLEGRCTKRYGLLSSFPLELVLNVKKIESFDVIPRVNENKRLKEATEELKHVTVNILTGYPFVKCPITRKHWKECLKPSQYVKEESFIHLFGLYCKKYNRYPESEDLWLFHAKMFKDYVYNEKIHSFIFSNVLEKFKGIMKTRNAASFVSLREFYRCEKRRLKME